MNESRTRDNPRPPSRRARGPFASAAAAVALWGAWPAAAQIPPPSPPGLQAPRVPVLPATSPPATSLPVPAASVPPVDVAGPVGVPLRGVLRDAAKPELPLSTQPMALDPEQVASERDAWLAEWRDLVTG